MIKYNNATRTFDSMYKQHNASSVTPNIMYGWVNQGLISLRDFTIWLNHISNNNQ